MWMRNLVTLLTVNLTLRRQASGHTCVELFILRIASEECLRRVVLIKFIGVGRRPILILARSFPVEGPGTV